MKKFIPFYSLLLLSATPAIFGNPEGFFLVSGKAVLSHPNPSTLEITTSDAAIIEWNSFSINNQETTRFIMPQSTSCVLNRVLGGLSSDILGTLEANGKVYLINPKGIVIGETGFVNTSSFIASSFDLLNQELFLDNDFAFSTKTEGAVINLGKILVQGGDVLLLGATVKNAGTIEALSAREEAGRVFLMTKEGQLEQSGAIKIPSGEVLLLGRQISLLNTALIDVSEDLGEGKILAGGDFQGANSELQNAEFTFIDHQAQLLANALIKGDGEHVVIWPDEGTSFHGLIEAQGGLLSGNGATNGTIHRGKLGITTPTGVSNVLAIADLNCTLTSSLANTEIVAINGTLNLVVDNPFPTSLTFGPGFFCINTNSVVSSTGTCRIYTSKRIENSVPNGITINGTAYTEQIPEGITTPQEACFVYSPGTSAPAVGTPFSVCYKELDVLPPSLLSKKEMEFLRYEAALVTSEIFYDLSLYDNFRFANWDYPNFFEEGSFGIVMANKGKVLSGYYLWVRREHPFHKFIPFDFSLPESFDIIAAAAEKDIELTGQDYIPLPVPAPISNPIPEIKKNRWTEESEIQTKEELPSSAEHLRSTKGARLPYFSF